MAGKRASKIYRSKLWRATRLQVFKRDGYRCSVCGRHYGRLECDHIIHLKDGGAALDPENLRTICRGCHIDYHRKLKEPQKSGGARKEMRELAHAGNF